MQVQNIALSLAEAICSASPDAVMATKLALEDAWRSGCAGVERSTTRVSDNPISQRVYTGQNIREGLAAFAERLAGAGTAHEETLGLVQTFVAEWRRLGWMHVQFAWGEHAGTRAAFWQSVGDALVRE